ncbi:GNAT family N-acetyltransferase [Haloactinomyces albus]|uniref:Acetyltransferase n=1 Tax=Haloactinomyces albus TaxID=1352928 RepID=A0AAE3ZH39_9ACTN|nr:GNAT family N-acetyltransferase [Haloactinomyces albus]MDR7303469.1 putative acetyltransferase [Haloactinomyces albus]
MSEHDVRPLAEAEFRDANRVFLSSLHRPAPTDQQWERSTARYEPGRVFGAFRSGELVGTTMALGSSLAVPGGAVLPASAVTGVGVRADHTRRGVLRALMRTQLDDVRDRGEPVAMLHASEAVIYGRFGYGEATRTRTVSLDTHRATLHADAPSGGSIRLLDKAEAGKILPELYRRIVSSRPGTISRSDGWWESRLGVFSGEQMVVAIHTGEDGVDDGFALYEAKMNDYRFDDGTCELQVGDIRGADAVATASLWRFLLGVDLVDRVVVIDRPVDEPLERLLTDRRACRVSSVQDDLWVRLVDVPAALAARGYGTAEPVVVEVRDGFLPENSGSYRIGADGVQRCAAQPQLSMDVDVLASLYLGDVGVSALAAGGRVAVHDPAAVAEADRLFAMTEAPWCGTGF